MEQPLPSGRPAPDSELSSMEDPRVVEDEKGTPTHVPSPAPPPAVPVSTPPFPSTMANFTDETVIGNRAVSMTSNDCSAALSSPAEASPAKPAASSPLDREGAVETSPATSHIASASDSLNCAATSLVSIAEPPPLLSELPPTTFGSSHLESDYSNALTFKGVTVTLENNKVWRQFHGCGTEMILTKPGRRMFPYCRFRLAGLDPERQYSLVLSIVPSDQYKYRWNRSQWEISGRAENQTQGLIRAFAHHFSTCRGSEWMGSFVSFYKLKLTNNSQDQDDHIILHSMHRYIPRLHVIPVPEDVVITPDQPVVMGPESMTFTFPQTEFMAVTTYQNFRITQLKITYNPFAKGFRENGNNPRLNRVATDAQPLVTLDTRADVSEQSESKEAAVDLSTKNHCVPAPVPNVQETRLVLKPIMSAPWKKDGPYVPCLRGKHALGELVLVEENLSVGVTPNSRPGPKVAPAPVTSTPGSSPRTRKRRKKMSRRWANYRQRELKPAAAASAAAAPPPVVHSPSLTVALQPELDDVEGLLFVSFTSKDALEVHIRNMPANGAASPASAVSLTTPNQLKKKVEVIPETDKEKIARMQSVLLQDLGVVKHRQVIHPVLQEVGLKLSSLDPTKSIDLQYLGVHLPLPPAPANLPEHVNSKSLGDNGLPFISRTGKTSDMTKIKGWRNKFIKRKKTSPTGDGLQKNLSAFCSDMLDEYLESEAQQISERAAAFFASPEGSVAYELPAKGSSYVKTLDSVLKHRTAASNRPCPLSHKPQPYSAPTSQAPPLPRPATPVQAEAPSTPQSTSSHTQSGASPAGDANATTGSTHTSAVSQRPTVSPGQIHPAANSPPGLTKFELKLWQMELGPLNRGLSRTQLTADRLSVALSVMLTKQMLYSHGFKVPSHPKHDDGRPECAQEFCRLGCVCSSLQHVNRGPLHCRRPDCMLGCDCFKRKITKQLSAGESEQQIQPVYSMTNKEHAVLPRPGSHTNKLWDRNTHDVDPDPLFAPKTPQYWVPPKSLKRTTQPINEEDKDPVYKYLESMMTCARVREFNSKPPPEVAEPKCIDVSAANETKTTKPQKTAADDPPRPYPRSKKTLKTAAKKTSQDTTASEVDAKKQIQIQSACVWDADHKMVLEALCQRMNQNRLSRRFRVGPYLLCPVAKIFMKKPSGSLVTYRVNISKPSTVSEEEEEEFDDSDEEKLSNKSFGEKEDDGPTEEGLEKRVRVTPFLSGVLPAGRLVAKTKPVGRQESGLIQVNGKAYNQARLLLGSIGSLHPANRLAAYVTGRLRAPTDVFPKGSKKPDSKPKNNTPGTLHVKSANAAVPPMITARRTTDLKMTTQPPVKLRLDSCRTGSIAIPQPPISSSIKAVQSFISSQLRSGFQSSSTSSPVSLTVSPALKTPNFLGQSGTYSFRICPPAGQGTRGPNPPGITLPGGFTLIELPKPGASATTQRSETVNTTNLASVDKSHRDALLSFGHTAAALDAKWLGLETPSAGRDLLSSRSLEPGSSSTMVHGEKMPSGPSDEANSKNVLDFFSEGLSSEDSDYCGEGDEDEEPLDVETVEEVEQEMAVAKLKQAPVDGSQEDQMFPVLTSNNRRRENHTVLERQRRSEQRTLFDKLQKVLHSDPKAPRLHHLALAQKEIRHLAETSKFLMDKKKMLTQIHADYVKKLSLLSGKTEMLIKTKLMDISQKQKIREKTMEFKPFFSKLLQSRAALLQDNTPQCFFQQTPLLQPDFFLPLSQAKPHAAAAQKNVQQTAGALQPKPQGVQSSVHTPKPLSPPQLHTKAASSPAEATAAAPVQVENQVSHRQSKLEDHQEAPEAPAQGTGPVSQARVPPGPASLQVTAAQDGASPGFSTPKPQNPFTQPSQSFTLPLIRSKTGRLILPSSMKPTGKPGFFTLMLMKAKKTEGESEISSSANTQPPGEDSERIQEKGCSSSDHLSGSDGSRILEQDKTTSSHSDPKRSPLTTPLTRLAVLNRSIHVPAAAAVAVKKKQAGATVPLAAARLSFNGVRQVSTSTEAVHNPIVLVRRRRGRPPKIKRVGRNRKREACVLVEGQSGSVELSRTGAGDSPGTASDVADSPVPVKRGRGRPSKKNTSAHPGGPVAGKERSPSKSNEDSPVRVSSRFKSPDTNTVTGDMNTSRPLTRGALGKDFPSAKRRSWIDLEKDLEPELESE